MSERGPTRRRTALRLRRALAAWRGSTLLRPILTLVSGTAAAQGIVFAARPILTRLYTPEAFGVLTVFTTLVAMGSVVASGTYNAAILLPRQDLRAAGLLALSLACAFATSLVALPVVAVAGLWITDPDLVRALWLLPPALLAADALYSLDRWHTRFDRFGLVSRLRLAQSAVVIAVQLAVGFASADALGLVGGAALGFGVAAGGAGLVVLARDRARLAEVTRAALMRLAGRYRRFPLYSAPAALLNIAATRAPVLLLAVFFGSAVVGQFGVAFGTLALPLGLLTGAVGQVFVVRAPAALRDGTLPDLTRTVLRGLWTATLFPALAVLVAGPSLFGFVFGETWVEAGRYAQFTAPWVLLAAVASPLTMLFDVLERQRADLSFSVVMFVVQAAVLVAASLAFDATAVVLTAGISGASLRLAHLAWILWLAKVPPTAALRDVAGAFARALPLVAVVFAVDQWGPGPAWTFAATTLGGLATLALALRQEARSSA